jgi:hypothetical protein
MKVDAEKLVAEKSAVHVSKETRTFAPLLEVAATHGFSRTNAYELVRRGFLETFKIGRVRYVVLDSLRSLPQHAGPDGVISLKPGSGEE